MKNTLAWSVALAVALLGGCGRPSRDSEADSKGIRQPLRIQPGVVAGESENWGYLGLQILKVHEHQSLLGAPPWHGPGGDWTFLECSVAKEPATRVVIGSRAKIPPQGEVPVGWGEGFVGVTDLSSGARFVEAFSRAFHQPSAAPHGNKPPGFLKAATAVFGVGLVRDPKGGFTAQRKGTWTTTKWFLQSETAEAEVFFNYSISSGQAEFCEKDEDYREELIEQLVVGLRDGPLPERTPENDPTLTLVGPRVTGWVQVAGTNETAQFTPRGDSLVITATEAGHGGRLFVAPIAQPENRKEMADFEGSILVHDFLYGESGLRLFLAETIHKDPRSYSSADPQRLWLVDGQGKRQLVIPEGITNWFAGKGSLSPDGRFLALHSWRKDSKLPSIRVIHLGDLQTGKWQTVELAGNALELVGWTGDKPTGVVLTGSGLKKGEARNAYSLEPEAGRLSPLATIPEEFNPGVMLAPGHRRAAEVKEKQLLLISELGSGQTREFAFHPSDRRNLYRDSVHWASERYLVFQGPRTAIIDADTLKMSFPVAKESGVDSVEFSPDFKWGLGSKKDGQFLGRVELPERSDASR